MPMYLALKEDSAINDCFFENQVIRLFLRQRINLVVDLASSKFLIQLLSINLEMFYDEFFLY